MPQLKPVKRMRNWQSSISKRRKCRPLNRSAPIPDVLAFDRGLGRLYVSAESGIISILDERGRSLAKIGEGFFAANAHSVAVDNRTHRVLPAAAECQRKARAQDCYAIG
jgi:hypothetical protein